MKKIKLLSLVIGFLLVFINSSFAQITFQKTYGGTQGDGFRFVQQTNDGGYIMVGNTNSFGAGNSDVYLVKTDSTGDTLWTRTYGGSENDYGYCVQQTTDSGYIITGYTQSFGYGNEKVYLIKTDAGGDTLWTKTYTGNTGWSNGLSVKQTIDGGYIVFGASDVNLAEYYLIKTNGIGDTIWTKFYETSANEYTGSIEQTIDSGYIVVGTVAEDVYLMKMDTNGNRIWKKSYQGINGNYGYSVKQTLDGGFILAGEQNLLGHSAYLIKANSIGDTLWTKSYGGDSSDFFTCIQNTRDSGYIISGGTNSFGAGNNDVYLIKTNAMGDTLWTKVFGGINREACFSVQQTLDGGYILAGYTNSFGAGSYDGYLIKTDANGNSGCNENGTATIVGIPIINIVIPIDTSSRQITIINSPPTLTGSGGIVTTLCITTDINEIVEANDLIIYPNPSSNFITINSNTEHKITSILIFNIFGEVCYSDKIDKNKEVISIKDFPNGFYFVSVELGNQAIRKKLIVSK